MANVTPDEVEEIIDVDSGLDVNPFILASSVLLDTILPSGQIGTAQRKEIERWLTAHFITIRQGQLEAQTIGDAKDTYALGSLSGGIKSTTYGQQAVALDTSGSLAKAEMPKAKLEVISPDLDDYET